MLQEFNQDQKAKVSVRLNKTSSADLAWWRTWTSSWWANVYF
ncbi:Trp operon leader peptide [Vibrio alfacsensis]|uniref:Trp operon leader peptide n=1 Tax=Vibrio alfacsensis TaxID=1074311 RepID=A0ABN5PDX0_9VIBR|nr:Trp operon leader peptide [Vibrio alfacsensis]AXY01381.1 Trp operon leader peptide [Vibrio alfacsensis]